MQNNDNKLFAYKLMSEIIEIEEEINLKRKQIQNRMKILDQIDKSQPNTQIQKFLLNIKPDAIDKRKRIDCEEQINAIPMPQGDIYDPIPMKMEEMLQ